MRERHRRRFHGIHPYRVVDPLSGWKLVFFVGMILFALVLSTLVLIEWYY